MRLPSASVRCGDKNAVPMGPVQKTSFGVGEVRFMWQAEHFVHLLSFSMWMLRGKRNEFVYCGRGVI